ncbi:head GIN domain-containing protein [Inhella sp.]|uniref:head GIN domain-containing protein n=1 Tax=Inhella sp. TaxID=1921806 RepID=UPI0035B1637C
MNKPRLAALTLACLALAPTAWATDKEWTLNIKQESNGLTIHLGGNTTVGDPGRRIKGSGRVVEPQRALAPFSRVQVKGPVDVVLVQGEREEARVRADDNLEALVTTQVEGDTLTVALKPGASFSTRTDLRVTVSFKQLQALQLSSSGDAKLDRFKGEKLALELNGSGDLRIGQLEVRELSAQLSGSGDLQLAGSAERQDWSLSGSGDLAYAGRPVVKSRVSGSGELMGR